MRFFIFAYFSWFGVLHQVREGLQKEKVRFSHLFVFALRLLVLRLSAYTCVRVRSRVSCRLCFKSGGSVCNTSFASIKREKTEKRFSCVLIGFLALNLIFYHLKHLNSLCAYTNKHGKISLLSVYLWLTIKLLKTKKTKPCGSSFPSCLSSCLLSEYLRKQKARCK